MAAQKRIPCMLLEVRKLNIKNILLQEALKHF